ncbi:hypothetical protein BU23DRAFT_590094 [Bimuria novae-zelandiae CBS 107.79]|uniref:RING-type domain-containing protein n=1 Tax=Bimuria novae-zelandiae CBS 107.79 TaxID=1447943 RepID=A0A6A5V8E8_9PLEO|nr:hypothetical protein BU23DRAFT_590094 [Bimuria novae-zelandiae CBS 107.79]
MATADPKLAPLADELKEFALTLERGVFPKNFFCALCDQLAFDSYKLLCCNKVICSSCHEKLEFPATCPSCDHSPVEPESCPPNKTLRNTMRIWLQKQRKKEENKAASEAPTPAIEPTPAPSEVQPSTGSADKPVESVEEAFRAEGGVNQSAADSSGADAPRPASAAPQRDETSTGAPDEPPQGASQDAKDVKEEKEEDQGDEPTEGQANAQDGNGSNGPINPNNAMMNANGMPNQFGFGFNNTAQGNFGMGMGMGPMNNMPNMMNAGWNNMGMTLNPSSYRSKSNHWSGYGMNNMNGMFGFGGNMGMGMNDMSMNYGGGFGNGWNGMGGGGGYGFNGYNQMGGYNQSGAYPEMMNQYPKNHMSNQNRFPGNGPGSFPQQRNSRNGSIGHGQGSGMQQNSRPGSRAGPNNRDGESPAGTADATAENQGKDEQASGSAETGQEGKTELSAIEADGTTEPAQAEGVVSADAPKAAEGPAATVNEAEESSGLNQIQTVDSIETGDQGFNPMMGGNMQMQYPHQMMNQFRHQMNGPYNHNMGYQNNNFGPRGAFNNAYGAATVLTGEPRGVGVEGAPTGPRAMREGRPNTGFSSRAINFRFNAVKSATPTAEAAATRSPPRRVRSRSPVRDDSLRTKDKSPSRSRASSQAIPAAQDETRDCSRSAAPESRDERPRSITPPLENDAEHELRKDKRRHRSSRYDDEPDERDDYDDRGRDDRDSRGSRGDRTRSASADSKYRSRREKDNREHKRRHHSRSISPGDVGYSKDKESSSRRKDRGDRDRYRDRSRDRERSRKDRKDRDYEGDNDDDKYRSRDKEKERRRRRDREAEEDERDYDEGKYRSSRRSRKDRDRDRDRDYDKESSTSTRAVSPPINAPTGPAADNFSIRGASKPKAKAMPPPQPPTGPRAFMPPKGPAADRDRGGRHSRKGSMTSSVPSTPTESAPQDHYAAEREKNARARDMLERGPERSLHSRISSSHSNSHGSSSRPTLSSKRSRDDYDDDEPSRDPPARDSKGIPTGPSASSHGSKRRKSGQDEGMDLASVLAKGMRKKAGQLPRRGGVKTEGDVERELERVERERDGRRW